MQEKQTKQKIILIIEDDTTHTSAYKNHLTDKYEIITALDGETGLKEALLHNPALIILDLIMPGKMDGFATLKELRKNEKTKYTPIIVISNLTEEERNRVLAMGANEYMTKTETDLKAISKRVDQYLQ